MDNKEKQELMEHFNNIIQKMAADHAQDFVVQTELKVIVDEKNDIIKKQYEKIEMLENALIEASKGEQEK